jgi:hypothetical protein
MLGILLGERYLVVASTMTRFVDVTQAPVFSQFADNMSGLAVIRARQGMQRRLTEELAASLLKWSAAKQAQLTCHRWIGVRLDFISACIRLWAGYLAIARAGVITAGLAGLSLSDASEYSENILALVRSMDELEIRYPSVSAHTPTYQQDLGGRTC